MIEFTISLVGLVIASIIVIWGACITVSLGNIRNELKQIKKEIIINEMLEDVRKN